ETQCPIFIVSGACAFCRRETLDEIGLFDEDYFIYFEDVDLSWRAWLRGWRCVYVPGAVLHHYRNVTTAHNEAHSLQARYLRERTRIWVLLQNMSFGSLLRDAPWIVGYTARRLVRGVKILASRERRPVEWESFRDACLGLRKTWRKRRAIQRARVC